MNSYQYLLAQKVALDKQAAELERKLAQAQKAAKADVIAQIKALMAQHGLTAADLASASSGSKSKQNGFSGGGKVAPKYRNPATGETWTGRGLKPKWMAAAIESGKKLGDFAI